MDVVGEVTQALPFQYCPLLHEEEVVLITQAVPLQYCPLGQEVLVPVVLDCGELQHPLLYQDHPEDAQTAES